MNDHLQYKYDIWFVKLPNEQKYFSILMISFPFSLEE